MNIFPESLPIFLASSADRYNWEEKGDYQESVFTAGKQSVSRELERVADGIRTHDLRNHNPEVVDSNSLAGKGLTATPDSGCTTGCTRLPENDNGTTAEVTSEADLKRLELLAADVRLSGIIDAWNEIPESVQNGLVAMVQASRVT